MQPITSIILSYRYDIEIVAIVAAIITAVSSFDDLFVDLYYWCLKLFGNRHTKNRANALLAARTANIPERPFAIMVPTWKEQNVIFSMLGANSRLLEYPNYHFFVGVYQNDMPTMREVERAQDEYPNIHMTIVPRNGPTSKADCLNEIIASIFDYETEYDLSFAGIVMHDAEDLIHPHELSLFNSLIGEYDFIQLPVLSFTRGLSDLIGGLYMDEFGETHTKDLVVREHLSGVVPCAGVAACFSWRAVQVLAERYAGELFRTTSFTEDYDIAFRAHECRLSSAFVSYPANFTIDVTRDMQMPHIVRRNLPIATREFFPSNLGNARRQRARWQLGIVFQGMSEHGWRGRLSMKYFLWRDRKGILSIPTVMIGYFVLANLVAIELYLHHYENGQVFNFELLSRDNVLALFALNLFFLSWRILHRMIFTTKIYGFAHGLMSVPRLIASNFVNFFATVRAVRVYFGHRITGRPLVWDKTAHFYPINLRTASISRERASNAQRRQRTGRDKDDRRKAV